jgi:NAD(P)-dependent dehydrogenase (short-subunit alcohol dehydrogenase family)
MFNAFSIYIYGTVGTNVQATFEIMQHSIPHLKLSVEESPSIINISSVNAKQAFKGCATYCASKAAVDQLSRCASLVSDVITFIYFHDV